jgi:hypothetical protein
MSSKRLAPRRWPKTTLHQAACGMTAVHQPHPLGLAVLLLDLAQEARKVVLSEVLPGKTS